MPKNATPKEKAQAKARELRKGAKALERAAGIEGAFVEIEEALGLRDRTHRYRTAKKYDLPMDSGDPVLAWKELSVLLFKRMVEYGERPESTEEQQLREKKLRGEVRVLQERYRKLENENEKQEGFLVDRREIKTDLSLLASFIRKAGDLMGRKSTLTGRDAQRILNAALDKYERKLDSITGQNEK